MTTQPNKSNSKINIAFMRLLIAVLKTALIIIAIAQTAQAEPRERHSKQSKNYILRRQEAYQVQGTPTTRLIIGRRQIDVYRNGQMFEGDNLVGVKERR